MNKIKMFQNEKGLSYKSKCGYVMEREHGRTPNGNQMGGRWVLRNPQGEMIGFDQYRHDLAEIHNLELQPMGA